MISIATKVKLITTVLSLTMIFNIFVTYYLIQDEKADAKIINISGKQRMLTQKMIAEYYRFSSGEAEAKEALFSTQEVFNTNIHRLRSGDLYLKENDEITALLNAVFKAWKAFESEMMHNLSHTNSDNLDRVYSLGNKTLELMDKTVMAYEMHATHKRDFINQIQLILALFTLCVIFYMGYVSLGIHTQLSKFLKHSKDISGREASSNGSELDLACTHIQYFLDDVEAAIDSAAQAVEQSEKASMKLAMAKQNSAAQEHLDKSEDIVIEANEELYKTSILLKKLKTKLQDAANPSF